MYLTYGDKLHDSIEQIDCAQCLHGFTATLFLQALEDVQSELNALSSGCAAINIALAADRSSSADLLSESDKLQHELVTSQKRSTLVQSFFKQYQLSAAEISALQVLVQAVILSAMIAEPAACCPAVCFFCFVQGLSSTKCS